LYVETSRVVPTKPTILIFKLNNIPTVKIPYAKNLDFVGCQDTLERLQKELEITGEHQPRAALWGLGGVGCILYIPQAINATNWL
jgi:hypothetical protein